MIEITQPAEDALALIYRTLGAHKMTMIEMRKRPKRRRLGIALDDREQMQRQATLVRILSITEIFCGERLIAEIESDIGPMPTPAVAAVWDAAAVRATNSWSEQERCYKEWVGVKVKWNTIRALADARNAAAHGLGTLTRRQRKKSSTVAVNLEPFDIKVQDGTLVLSEISLELVATECRRHIRDIDLAVQAAHSIP